METQTENQQRIGSALRALRTIHSADGKEQLGIRCLQAVITELASQGVAPEDLQPLAELEGLVTGAGDMPPGTDTAERHRERRRGAPPSSVLLARASVIIDLLVKAGQPESTAAQAVMRLLMSAGVPSPKQGGDSRGWRRLLEFRHGLVKGAADDDALHEYQEFSHELDDIPPAERVDRALNAGLWNRRRHDR